MCGAERRTEVRGEDDPPELQNPSHPVALGTCDSWFPCGLRGPVAADLARAPLRSARARPSLRPPLALFMKTPESMGESR